MGMHFFLYKNIDIVYEGFPLRQGREKSVR
jgi:hypothetical protein